MLRLARLGALASLVLVAAPLRAQPQPEPAPPPPPAETPAPAPDAPEPEPAPEPAPEAAPEPDPAPSPAPVAELPEDPAVVEQRQREAAQAARESAQPREPLVDVEPPEAPKWERHLELGAAFAFVLRPYANALEPSDIGYAPAPGFAVHLHWPVFSWLRFHPYFMHAFHSLDIPQGALVADSDNSISPDATISDASVATFVLGAKIAPTLEFSERWRGWVTAGIGWGRFELPKMTVTEPDGATFEIRERAGVVIEFPLGLGISVDVIERWMAVHYEATAAPVTGQSGSAHEVFQAVDDEGTIRDVGAFGAIDVSIVQTLGVSIIL